MTTLTNAVLNTPALNRFIETANYKHGWTVLLTDIYPEALLKGNAELIDVSPYDYPPYTARARFRVDRLCTMNGLPLNEKLRGKQFISRNLLIKQVRATEIVDAFGVGGRIYLGLTANPENTQELATRINELFGLQVTAEDILAQEIPDEASCVIVKFDRKSIGFTGSFQVDLYTPLVVAADDESAGGL